MADDTKNGTLRSVLGLGTNAVKAERATTILDSTVEVAAAASAGTVYTMFRIPSRARISGASIMSWDDLASTGAPTLDIGFKAVDGNITTDPDALNDGLDAATATTAARVVKDIANYGKFAWEHVSGQTSDPGGFLDVTVSILDAATNTGGTITMVLAYNVD